MFHVIRKIFCVDRMVAVDCEAPTQTNKPMFVVDRQGSLVDLDVMVRT